MCIKYYNTQPPNCRFWRKVDLCSSLKSVHDRQYIQLIWHIHIFTSKTLYFQHYLLNIYRLHLWSLPVTICDPCTYWGGKKNKMLCSGYYGFSSFFLLLITKIIRVIHVTESHAMPLPVSPKCTIVYVIARCIVSILSKNQVHMALELTANLNFWSWVKGSGGLLTFLPLGLRTYTPSEQEASLQVSCSS